MPCDNKNDQRKVMAFHADPAKPRFINSRPRSTWLERGLVLLPAFTSQFLSIPKFFFFFKFLDLKSGRLFEVGAYSRPGAY